MKEGKVVLIDKLESFSESDLEKLRERMCKEKIAVEFATELSKNGFYSLPEALLALLKKGVKKVSAFPLSLGEEYEVPLYWGTY